MTVEEGLAFFENIPSVYRKLKTLYDVGLGYIKIGQPSTTLSGGEAQRVKLATELSKRSTGKTVYILDEPTTGLHTADVQKLIEVLQKLVDAGNSVVVIEHNLDVIKSADYVIDLGPEGGDNGGQIVVTGTPREVAKCKKSYTGTIFKNRILAKIKRGLASLLFYPFDFICKVILFLQFYFFFVVFNKGFGIDGFSLLFIISKDLLQFCPAFVLFLSFLPEIL